MDDQTVRRPLSKHEALPLSRRLAERTRELHIEAEKSGVIADILKGRADLYGYAVLLRNLLAAYEAMEACLRESAAVPGVRAFAAPEIFRAPAIRADLAALIGSGWEQSLPLLDEARNYAQRIATVSRGRPTPLIGHAYTRYFGDLSGGQILKRILSQTMGLKAEALAFYRFPQIANPTLYKTRLRGIIDRDEGDLDNAESAVEEAAVAFRLNIDLSVAVKRPLRSPD